MKTGTITWDEINGVGTLTLVWDSGGEHETIKHDQPINASTDSDDIAALFCDADVIDHDRDYIHIGFCSG
jgi:hypothetical protein